MAITFPRTVPPEFMNNIGFGDINKVSVTPSEFTGGLEIQSYEGEWWTWKVTWAILDRTEGEHLAAILSSLRGPKYPCILTDIINVTPMGAAKDFPSSPRVDGAGQQGELISIKNAPVSLTNWLIIGDRIQIGPDTRPRYYKVLEDVSTDASGKATFSIWPRLKQPIINNDPIVYNNPKGLFVRDTSNFEYGVEPPALYRLSDGFRESFP